ncbi:MAG: MoxR family ATPase [Bdellovibrionota bacterium]
MSFNQFSGNESYVADRELLNAVNVAIALQKPLVIRGEPGTGKTVLAHAIASSLSFDLFPWHIKSTTKAQDGLYAYDTVQRLNDSRFGDKDVSNIDDYIKLGPIGRAFEHEKQSVLLIDEIDKADIEFPNDLLHELDSMSFYIPETQKTVRAKHRPIVIITSNNEKELPDAFLRRCIFHFIRFPDVDLMRKIIAVHHTTLEESLVEQCLARFYWLRSQSNIRKKPSTSELLDWINALIAAGISQDLLHKEIPFLGVLLKKEDDLEQFS